MSGCKVFQEDQKVDQFYLFNKRMVGGMWQSPPIWICILDNLVRCYDYIKNLDLEEILEEKVVAKIWTGQGSNHFVSQVVKFLKLGPRVYLRIDRVYFEINGEVKYCRVDVPFSLEDCLKLRGFIFQKLQSANSVSLI